MRIPINILGPLFLLAIQTVIVVSFSDDTIDDEEFLDPGDMLNYDLGKKRNIQKKNLGVVPPKQSIVEENRSLEQQEVSDSRMDKKENEPKLVENEGQRNAEKKDVSCKPCDIDQCPVQLDQLYYRQHVQNLLKKFETKPFGSSPLSYKAIISLDRDGFKSLTDYTKGKGNIQDVNTVLNNMILQIKVAKEDYIVFESGFMYYLKIYSQPTIQVLSIVLILLVILRVSQQIIIPWKLILFRIVIMSFIIGIPWNWINLYKTKVSEKQASVLKGRPPHCKPNNPSWQHSLSSWFQSLYVVEEDECAKYHASLTVDPLWEVTPPQAIAVTFTKFFLEPAELIGNAISKFFRGLFQHVPPVMYPVVLAITVLIIILLILMVFGYRIKIPFFLTVEPSQQPVDIKSQEALQEVQSAIKDIQSQQKEILQHMPMIQQTMSNTRTLMSADHGQRSLNYDRGDQGTLMITSNAKESVKQCPVSNLEFRAHKPESPIKIDSLTLSKPETKFECSEKTSEHSQDVGALDTKMETERSIPLNASNKSLVSDISSENNDKNTFRTPLVEDVGMDCD